MALPQKAPRSRFGHEGQRLLAIMQLVLVGNVVVIAILATLGDAGADTLVSVFRIGGALIATTFIAIAIPWRRVGNNWAILIAVADLALIGALNEALFTYQRGIGIIAVIPVLWLSYRFGRGTIAVSIIGDIFVGIYPYARTGNWPSTPGEWGSSFLPAASIAVVAITVSAAARYGNVQRSELRNAYENLRVSVASGLVGDEALRASVASGVVGDEALRVSVAEGLVGDEALRVSVAKGLVGDEALRVSVAEGLVGDEALRVSVAKGLVGDEALRVSVAEGVVGAEALRVSVAEGLVGDEALRVSVAKGLVGDEALRVSVAEGVVGAEALRASVAEGLVGVAALRISEQRGDDGEEALRVAVANGLDAASAALAVVDTVDAGITFYDPRGVVLLTNDTARALIASGKFDGAPLVFGDDRVTPIPVIDQILARATRGELVTRRAYFVGEGDDQRAMMATSQFVRRASGDLLGTVVATHDVTPLANAIRQRDEFLETVSHELRTPLTSIIGYLEVIEDSIDLTENGIAREFAVIQRNTGRLLKLITDLLLTAENQSLLERRPFNIADLATNSLNAIRPAAAIAGVQIVTPTLQAVLAEVDAERISDVLDKVLSNALKFNKPGGEVSLTVEQVSHEVIVRIRDTGIGMTDADQAHIFERFFRSAESRRGVVAGAGLGLSTAKLIVDAHNGSLTAESTLGTGTTMELRLPLTVD